MTRTYLACGLRIRSEIPLPELIEDAAPGTEGDVMIEVGSTPAPSIVDGWRQLSPFIWVADAAFLLHVPGVARYLVQDGARITVQSEGADEDSIRVFLLASGLGALLFQRGLLVLHGSAVEIDGKCAILVGHSAVGTSTLAAALIKRGHRLVGDDVLPIDRNGVALTGVPRIKLWHDSAQRLGFEPASLPRLRPSLNKYILAAASTPAGQALDVRWVYILRRAHAADPSISPVAGMNRFVPLLGHTYRRRVMEGMALSSRHLLSCGKLAGRVHMAYLDRPALGFQIERLADVMLEDAARHG